MAGKTDDAKAAADKASAAAKLEDAKAKAEAMAKAARSTKRAAKDEVQVHGVTREVMHSGETYLAGDDIELTRPQHAQLFAVGAVEDDWRD